jgi:hypothetical protein
MNWRRYGRKRLWSLNPLKPGSTYMSLEVFEGKVLRKIFAPIRDTDQWRRRYNEGLYQLYAEPEIVKRIRSARLRWAGHIVRMSESDQARKSTFDLLLGERTVGRPKRRWIEEVERELEWV